MKSLLSFSVISVALLSGCSTFTSNTNRESYIPTPSISSTNTLAEIEVGEKIQGNGCATTVFWFFNTDQEEKYLEIDGEHDSDTVKRAKAEATYNALAGKNGLTTDIMVHPIWSITVHRDFLRFNVQACAQVTGYRGIIKSFKKSDTITDPANQKSDSASSKSGIFSNVERFFTSDKNKEIK